MKLFSFIVNAYRQLLKLIGIYMTKAERIKEERKRLGYTQQAVADFCGVHRVQWGRYERGEQGFDGAPLRKFGELGADISFVLTGIRTPEVEMTVLNKVSKAKQTAKRSGNEAGASNLDEGMSDMVSGMIKRGENAKKREDALRQITYMLCELDDEAFKKAFDAVADIHSGKEQEVVEAVESTKINVSGNGDISKSIVGSPNSRIENSFNTQSGLTETPFIIICMICGFSAWGLAYLANVTIADNFALSATFWAVATFLWFVTIVSSVFGWSISKQKKLTTLEAVSSYEPQSKVTDKSPPCRALHLPYRQTLSPSSRSH